MERFSKIAVAGGFWLALLLTAIVYLPGLSGPFLLDDADTLSALSLDGDTLFGDRLYKIVLTNNAGGLGRPVSMLSFLLNDQGWPASPFWFKVTNLSLHLICGLLIALVSIRLSRALNLSASQANWVSLLVMSVWLLHPLNVSTVLYVVQRMTQLATLFSLIAIMLFVVIRPSVAKWRGRQFLYLFVLFPVLVSLAVFSKETGVLVFGYILLLEAVVYKRYPKCRYYKLWFSLVVVFPVLVIAGVFIVDMANYLSAYQTRSFTLYERLLTESRVVLDYLRLILIPNTTGMGLYHDDVVVSRGLISPYRTLLSIVFWLVLVVCMFIWGRKYKVVTFGIAWFCVGHVLESTWLPLELYFEHRNYLPMYGVLLALSIIVVKLCSQNKRYYILPAIFMVYAVFGSMQLTKVWANKGALHYTWAVEHPDSIRANSQFVLQLLGDGFNQSAQEMSEKMLFKHQNELSVHLLAMVVACQIGGDIEGKYKRLERADISDSGLDSVLSHLNALKMFVIQERCGSFNVEKLDKVMALALATKIYKKSNKGAAQIYYYRSELSQYQRNFGATLNYLDKAYALSPQQSILLKKTALLIDAGVVEEAKISLDLLRLNDGREIRYLSRKNEIAILVGRLNQLIEKNN